MTTARAKRRHRKHWLRRAGIFCISVPALFALLAGFVYWTRLAVHMQAIAPPGAEHPFDWEAEGCLALALVLLAVLLLARTPSPQHWRKTGGQLAQIRGARVTKTGKRMRRLRVQ